MTELHVDPLSVVFSLAQIFFCEEKKNFAFLSQHCRVHWIRPKSTLPYTKV